MFETHPPTHRILIVDDAFVPRSLESIALESTGRYYTIETGNGVDALTALSGEKCDCVVIDLAMPDMSGLELVKRIRHNRRSHDLPIVLVLPEGGMTEIPEHVPGVNQIIAKPFDPWSLVGVLDMLTHATDNADTVLSIEAVLRGFPYPTMIMDAEHHVVLANGVFYKDTGAGLGEHYVHCSEYMHEGGEVVDGCPLVESLNSGQPAERTVSTLKGEMVISVYPLATKVGSTDRLFLHVTQPVHATA
jgi:two-component system, chemotaxis family, chemotaxis protein CheY